MFVREIKKPNGSSTIAIVESIRVEKKVIQKVIRTFGTHKDALEIAIIKKAAEDVLIEMLNSANPVFPGLDPYDFYIKKLRNKKDSEQINVDGLEHIGSIPVGVQEIFTPLMEQLGLDNLIKESNKDSEWNDNLKNLIMARIEEPSSKLNTSEILERNYEITLPVQKIYRTMDKISAIEDDIKEKIRLSTLNTLDQKIHVMFYDVTTIYFESFRPDELRHQGFSKDCKFKETQVVLALATTTEGLPLTYELFPGNTSEGKTLIKVIEKMKFKYGAEKILLVADRAMFNEVNLSTLDDLNVEYIVAAKLKSLPKEMKDKILIHKEAQDPDLKYWHQEYNFKNRRLIVNYTKDRKNKDEHDRVKLVDRLEKKIKNKNIPVSELITNQGTKKYVDIKSGSSASINTDKIENDKKWDGLHGVITNKNNLIEVEEVLKTYKGLWQIEEAFRITKTDLKVRPIYHWKPSRIKAHILICFIAYTLLSHLRYRLKKNNIELSPRKIKDELNRVVKVKIRNKATKTNIILPTKLNEIQKSIYSTMNVKTQLQKATVL